MSVGACIENPNLENLTSYRSYYAIAFQYMPEQLHKQMRAINSSFGEDDFESAAYEYEELALKMQVHIKQS